MGKINRRNFIKSSGSLVSGAVVSGALVSSAALTGRAQAPSSGRNAGVNLRGPANFPNPETASAAAGQHFVRVKNKLPKWRGFNLLDLFSPDPSQSRPATTEEQFKWMSGWGFDFVRIPMAYPAYLDFDRSRAILPDEVYNINEEALEKVDNLVALAHKYGMHASLNLHRAPGYCINAGFREPYYLWTDQEALDAFCFHWEMWARRYRDIPAGKISFDLVNEPSMIGNMNDQHSSKGPVPGHLYRKVAKAASEAIRGVSPRRLIIADGNNVGSEVIPEITDLDIGQSCRGYTPGIISHYKAPWANKDPENLPEPKWPGQVGDRYLSRELLEEAYKPWIALLESGTGVHCGECGCWNKTPHDVFLAWFNDVLDILSSNGIGYSIWEFSGDFGVLNSGRKDVEYENWYGQQLDRKMLNLLMKY
ncbi:aryl-phospho-beta-D-glucosidase BglC (GH1 family) [Anseongella ginsenosidimutans]|uniref:Aryl-phospho-beta-D-glucosidase BglC (GH1 family) n=1 Tax=Anseongella ginsenosidimutans TaxID=496056 RepID=A0A4R3KQB2_9SPHI|nr:cellulase family glycosylhydrolase [Anseongella ginsenosidimutans]QEC53950.1 cellulase family glycosylhydrolase [Anseongella ginsenosidimutans]TCS86337.1 aryl-phospho-beta-D-glucosidase BglC (GH1 family) [Anseongella ginsenosidimutans]